MLWGVLCDTLPLWKRPSDSATQEQSPHEEGRDGEGGGGGQRVSAPPGKVTEEGEGEGDTGGNQRSGVVIAQFTSACDGKPLTKAKEAQMVRFAHV